MAEKVHLTVTFLYAFNMVADRKQLWDDLIDIRLSFPVSSHPWSIVRDFNQFIKTSNTQGSLKLLLTPHGLIIDDMNLMLQEDELFEAQAKGVPFTWWNNNEADPISKRIDHALIN